MMNVPRRWAKIDPEALDAKCREVGLTAEEASRIVDWLKRRNMG